MIGITMESLYKEGTSIINNIKYSQIDNDIKTSVIEGVFPTILEKSEVVSVSKYPKMIRTNLVEYISDEVHLTNRFNSSRVSVNKSVKNKETKENESDFNSNHFSINNIFFDCDLYIENEERTKEELISEILRVVEKSFNISVNVFTIVNLGEKSFHILIPVESVKLTFDEYLNFNEKIIDITEGLGLDTIHQLNAKTYINNSNKETKDGTIINVQHVQYVKEEILEEIKITSYTKNFSFLPKIKNIISSSSINSFSKTSLTFRNRQILPKRLRNRLNFNLISVNDIKLTNKVNNILDSVNKNKLLDKKEIKDVLSLINSEHFGLIKYSVSVDEKSKEQEFNEMMISTGNISELPYSCKKAATLNKNGDTEFGKSIEFLQEARRKDGLLYIRNIKNSNKILGDKNIEKSQVLAIFCNKFSQEIYNHRNFETESKESSNNKSSNPGIDKVITLTLCGTYKTDTCLNEDDFYLIAKEALKEFNIQVSLEEIKVLVESHTWNDGSRELSFNLRTNNRKDRKDRKNTHSHEHFSDILLESVLNLVEIEGKTEIIKNGYSSIKIKLTNIHNSTRKSINTLTSILDGIIKIEVIRGKGTFLIMKRINFKFVEFLAKNMFRIIPDTGTIRLSKFNKIKMINTNSIFIREFLEDEKSNKSDVEKSVDLLLRNLLVERKEEMAPTNIYELINFFQKNAKGKILEKKKISEEFELIPI